MWELQDQLIDASAVLPGMDRAGRMILRNMAREQRLDHLSSALAHSFRIGRPDIARRRSITRWR